MLKRDNLIKNSGEADIPILPEPTTETAFNSRQAQSSFPMIIKEHFYKMVITGVIVLITGFFLIQMTTSGMEGFIERSLDKTSGKLEGSIVKINWQLQEALHQLSKQINLSIGATSTEIQKMIPSKPGNRIEEELHRAMDHPISPERQEKIVRSIRVVVKRLRPFVKEISPLFSDEVK